MHRHVPWPFHGDRFPPELGAVVQQTVLEGDLPALLAAHTTDNDWLVGDGTNDPNVPGAAVATHLSHIVERSSSVAALATLAPGYQATRAAPGRPWVISRFDWEPEPD